MRTLRSAVDADLDAIAAITRSNRAQLAEWSPEWWAPAPAADEIHRLWLGHLIGLEDTPVRVLEGDDGAVAGCAVLVRQPAQWFVDDIGVTAPNRWPDVGVELFRLIAERPALTCIATLDIARAVTARAAGLRLLSQYWIRRATAPGFAPTAEPLSRSATIPDSAPHTFGGPLDPWAEGALSFALGDGIVVGSPPFAAPPIYGSGGTVGIVDRVAGPRRSDLLDGALAASAGRDDRLLNVIAAARDLELQGLLAERGFVPTVSVFGWP